MKVSAYLEVILNQSNCHGDPDYIDCYAKIKRVQKQRLLFGNITFLALLDDNFTVEIIGYVKQGGQYRLMPYKIVKPFCSAYNEDPFFMDDMRASSTLPPKNVCPFPLGTYYINGYTPSMKNMPLCVMPSGDYRTHLSYKKNGTLIFEAIFHATVIQV